MQYDNQKLLDWVVNVVYVNSLLENIYLECPFTVHLPLHSGDPRALFLSFGKFFAKQCYPAFYFYLMRIIFYMQLSKMLLLTDLPFSFYKRTRNMYMN